MKTKQLNIRLSPIAQKQLADLIHRWGETPSNVIRRAIAEAHQRKEPKK